MPNTIEVITVNGETKKVQNMPGLAVNFLGDNAKVVFKEPIPKIVNCKFVLGNLATIIIADSTRYINELIIDASQCNSLVKIGRDFSCYRTDIFLGAEPNLSVVIGDNCMFAYGTEIRTSDAHSIIDKTNGKVVNFGKSITIGNHVWITKNCKILKGVELQDWTVIGIGSIVTKRIMEKECVVAGCPAKVVKRGIRWDYKSPKLYDSPYFDEEYIEIISNNENISSNITILNKDVLINASSDIYNAWSSIAMNFEKGKKYKISVDNIEVLEGNVQHAQLAIKAANSNTTYIIKNVMVGCHFEFVIKVLKDIANAILKVYSGEVKNANDRSIQVDNLTIAIVE